MSRNGLAFSKRQSRSSAHDVAAIVQELLQKQAAIRQHQAALVQLQTESGRLQRLLIGCALGVAAVDEDVIWSGIPPTSTMRGLTCRERQVALLIAKGLTNRRIAAQLVIAERTADTHVQNLLAKLGCDSRSQVAALLLANPEA